MFKPVILVPGESRCDAIRFPEGGSCKEPRDGYEAYRVCRMDVWPLNGGTSHFRVFAQGAEGILKTGQEAKPQPAIEGQIPTDGCHKSYINFR